MLENELQEAIRDEKSPLIRIIIIAAFMIISTLYIGNLVTQNKRDRDNESRIKYLESQVAQKDRKLDSQTIQQYRFVVEMLDNKDRLQDFKNSWDSLNSELITIKQTLTTK